MNVTCDRGYAAEQAGLQETDQGRRTKPIIARPSLSQRTPQRRSARLAKGGARGAGGASPKQRGHWRLGRSADGGDERFAAPMRAFNRRRRSASRRRTDHQLI